MRLFTRPLPETAEEKQRGINMVDLMMWLVIAALLLAAAIQSIGYYQKASWTYQAKNDVSNVQTWAAARVAVDGKVPSIDDMNAAITSGDLKLTKNAGLANTGLIAVQGDKYCVGVQSSVLTGSNVFYSSSDSPSNILQDTTIPAACGTVTSASPSPTGTATASPTATSTATATATAAPLPTTTTATWSASSNSLPAPFLALAGSTDLTRLLGGENSSYEAYVSTNGGTSWSMPSIGNGSAGMFAAVASSADGMTLITGQNGGGVYSQIYTSTDGGTNWVKQSIPQKDKWTSFAASGDGKKLVASATGGGNTIYASPDAGVSWVNQTPTAGTGFTSLAYSGDGTKLWGLQNGKVVLSTDNGAHFTIQNTPAGAGIQSIRTSSDGNALIVGIQGGNIYTSTDAAGTWTSRPITGNWQTTYVSPDGAKMIAGDFSNYGLYISRDFGANWTKQTGLPNLNWTGAMVSADGTKFVAVSRTTSNVYKGTL